MLLLRENFGEGPKRTREISEEDVDVIQQERSRWIKIDEKIELTGLGD